MVSHASAAHGGSSWQPPVWWPVLSARLAAVAIAMFWLVSIWFLVRRLAGTLQPLEPLVLVLVGLLVAGSILGGREVVARIRPSIDRRRLCLWWIFTSAGLVCFGWALSIAGTNVIGLCGFWMVLTAQELAAWRRWAVHRIRWTEPGLVADSTEPRMPMTGPAEQPDGPAEQPDGPDGSFSEPAEFGRVGLAVGTPEDADIEDDEAGDGLLAAGVSQQVTRSRVGAESEIIAGLLRAELAAGERNCSLHVAFCPALQHDPNVEVMAIAGAPARVKAADVQLFGVRFEVRLAESSRLAQEVILHFEARSLESRPTAPSLG